MTRESSLRSLVALIFCLTLACGGDGDGSGPGDGGGGAGRGGAGADGGAGRGGSGGGAGGRGGTTGSAGASGSGGSAACQTCVSCMETNCATVIGQCQADTGCNAVYQCVRQCTGSVQSCATMNLAGAVSWAQMVGSCFNQNCAQMCQL